MSNQKTNLWDVLIAAMERGQLLLLLFALVVLILFAKMSQDAVDRLFLSLTKKMGVLFIIATILAVIGWVLYFSQKKFYNRKFNELKNKRK